MMFNDLLSPITPRQDLRRADERAKGTLMASRHYSTLISLFPNLGGSGASPEARSATIPAYLQQSLQAAVSNYDPALRDAISFWTVNNAKILPFMADENNRGTLDAFCAEFGKRHALLMSLDNVSGAEAAALNWARRVKNSSDQLRQACTPLSVTPNHIYRGEAIDVGLVHSTYQIGQTITWGLPKACTLNHDFVPLHYAWKQCHPASRTIASPAGLLLNIMLNPAKSANLLWAGWVVAQKPVLDVRWQQEVIVLPTFHFKILSCRAIQTVSVPLYQVEAEQI